MRIGIVGSRTFPNLEMIRGLIAALPPGAVVVSGGAAGVDQAAATFARQAGFEVKEWLPDLSGCKTRSDYTERYYARNRRIVADSDRVVAFTDLDSGGTWYTIKAAKAAEKPVRIVRSADSPNYKEILSSEPEPFRLPKTGKFYGPYHIKRAGLGTLAIHKKQNFSSEEFAGIIAAKDAAPIDLGRRMAEDIVPTLKELGHVDLLTMPPRSIRNLDKPHAVAECMKSISSSTGIRCIQAFAPWNKIKRGVHAAPPKIKVLPEAAAEIIGRVVIVLDDISTTNATMAAAVSALKSAGAHVHGIIWIAF